jgi:hypothetical protein
MGERELISLSFKGKLNLLSLRRTLLLDIHRKLLRAYDGRLGNARQYNE